MKDQQREVKDPKLDEYLIKVLTHDFVLNICSVPGSKSKFKTIMIRGVKPKSYFDLCLIKLAQQTYMAMCNSSMLLIFAEWNNCTSWNNVVEKSSE